MRRSRRHRSGGRALPVALAVVGVAALGVPAWGQSATAPSREQELERAIGEAGQAEIAALSALDAATERRVTAEAELTALDARLTAAQADLQVAEAKAEDASGEFFAAQYELDRAEARLRAAQARVREATGSWYLVAADDGAIEAVAGLIEDDFSDAGARSEYLEAVHEKAHDVAVRAESDTAELLALRSSMDDARQVQNDAVDVAEAARDALAALREEQADRRSDLLRAEEDERRLVESIRSRKDEYEAELNRLRVESGSIGTMLAARQIGQPRAEPTMVLRPVPGVVVSKFGPRLHPILGYVRMHQGVDMDADMGDPIFAYADGVVVWAGERGGYGNCVIIDHGNQFGTLYAHQSQMAVTVGQTVRGGEVIGFIGSTGLSSGPHLHFEVRDLGVPVDPEPFLST